MPPVQSVFLSPTELTIVDRVNTKRLLVSQIPSSMNTSAKIEAWVNTWLETNITDYQTLVHVFRARPLIWTVGTWDIGAPIETEWWRDA